MGKLFKSGSLTRYFLTLALWNATTKTTFADLTPLQFKKKQNSRQRNKTMESVMLTTSPSLSHLAWQFLSLFLWRYSFTGQKDAERMNTTKDDGESMSTEM